MSSSRSIPGRPAGAINKLINMYILKSGEHKNEISQLINIPCDIRDDALYIVTWAQEVLQKILDNRNIAIDI